MCHSKVNDMNFTLPEELDDLSRALRHWVDGNRAVGSATLSGFKIERWRDLLRWNILDPEATESDQLLRSAVACFEVARGTMPGPLLEAYLALAAGSDQAAEALDRGQVVTSLLLAPGGAPSVVGWGAVADLVVDQSSGETIHVGPLPPVKTAYTIPHGWLNDAHESRPDLLQNKRWVIASALMAGLCVGAMEMTTEHVKSREQFGRPLAAFQGVQFPLAECFAFTSAMRMMALDAAWRGTTDDPSSLNAAALAWQWATWTSHRVTKACQQSFGASGFCEETGLSEFVWQMGWLRNSVGNRETYTLVSREWAPSSDDPPSLILSGFTSE